MNSIDKALSYGWSAMEVHTMEKNQPEKKFRAGGISVAVWKNESKDSKGVSREFRSVSFEKGYKDKSGEWKSTNSLHASDIPKAIVVLSKAYEYLTLRGQGEAA